MNKRIFIAGHNGMVGPALSRLLKKDKNNRIVGELAQNKSFPTGERIESAKDFLAGVSLQ